MADAAQHWNAVYESKSVEDVSWFESSPAVSVRLICDASDERCRVVDVGAGASTLADALVAREFDVTVLDVSEASLALVRDRLGDEIAYVVSDVLAWHPQQQFDVWHDRAVFHFLTDPQARQQYGARARAALAPGGVLVVGTFALDGPTACSGLPTERYDVDALTSAFAEGFVPEHHERVEHSTPWGSIQPFTWVVMRRVV